VKYTTEANNLSLHLVPMRIADLDAVLRIEHRSFTMPWTEGMFLSELRNIPTSHLLVARLGESQGQIVGYIGYRVVIDEMHIVVLAVDPTWRQRGIARSLLGAAMDQARQAACTRATLEVRVSNSVAQKLYYSLGFAPVGTRPRYYIRPPEDALILWRDPL
jgi:ribosomal-protein-alanine N-acetyltransferase